MLRCGNQLDMSKKEQKGKGTRVKKEGGCWEMRLEGEIETRHAGIWREEARAGMLLKCLGSCLAQRHTLGMSPSSVGH